MKIVVCTAWFGKADALKPPRVPNPRVPMLCLTDRSDQVRGWRMHKTVRTDRPRWLARWAKTNFEWVPPAHVVIWMDASFELLVDPVELVRAAAATNAPVVALRHPDRSRISDEAEAIIRAAQAPAPAVRAQLETYQAAGFDTPANPQRLLSSTGLLVSWMSPDVRRFFAAWWQEITTHTLRDQLSFDYTAWKERIPIGYLPGHYRHNPFARYDHTTHRLGRIAS
jgi:hypothetical protein